MLTASEIRAERNARLYFCEWTQAPDAPLTENEKARWREYRQNLRDVPQQPGFPDSFVWPVEPDRDVPFVGDTLDA